MKRRTNPAHRPATSRSPGRRTNLALLGALVMAFATGLTVPALGTAGVGGWMAALHGVAGLTALVLAPWKTSVARRGIARRNRHRVASVVMASLVVATLIAGLLHSIGIPNRVGPFTVLWLHVVTALLAAPLAVWHVLARRTLPRGADLSRRNFVRTALLASAATVAWWGVDRSVALAGLPGARRRFSGSHELSSFRPDGMPVTSWLDDRTPEIDPTAWLVTVADASGRRHWGLADLSVFSPEDLTAVLDCTSGWYSEQVWTGVRLDRLVDPGQARSIVVWSASGYARRFPVRDLSALWLATEVGGQSLSAGHGFPARLVAPGRRGFWWVKWVVRLETSEFPWWMQSPYPAT
ncbi:MAG TPA: molybdopterin-dependent oxidoreductase [Acidimicrobiia bacterium]|nr:molybdopterin-dependent oxidoreductase [Acidimicrobiia bacterium]